MIPLPDGTAFVQMGQAVVHAARAAWQWLRGGPKTGPGSGLTNQTRSELLKSKSSFEKLIAEHRQKLADYKSNPLGHDNLGVLKNAPSPEIRQKIIEGRIRELESQIAKQEGELRKVLDLLK
jgi:hypothetical protein